MICMRRTNSVLLQRVHEIVLAADLVQNFQTHPSFYLQLDDPHSQEYIAIQAEDSERRDGARIKRSITVGRYRSVLSKDPFIQHLPPSRRRVKETLTEIAMERSGVPYWWSHSTTETDGHGGASNWTPDLRRKAKELADQLAQEDWCSRLAQYPDVERSLTSMWCAVVYKVDTECL